jgi:uncharacterized Zn-binding protein involved in type VI secretion
MPAAVRLGDLCSGHASGFPPRATTSGSPDKFVNGLAQHRVTDTLAVHSNGSSSHSSTTAAGSPDSFVNGLAKARVGDAVACGSTLAQGSPDVEIN